MRAQDTVTGRTEERRFYVKVYRDEEQGKRTYEVIRALWDRASAGGDVFAVGRPIAYLSGLGALIQEEVTGTDLHQLLHLGDDVVPAMRRVARALAALHLGQTVTSRRRPLQRDIAILKRAGELLPLACPHLKSEIEEIIATIIAGLEEVPPAPTHCDLAPKHIVFDDDHLILLDLDEFAGADPILDVARLLVSLGTAPLRLTIPQERGQIAARAFLEEYFAHAPEAWRARLPLHYAGGLLKKAAIGFHRRQAPGGLDRVEAMVEKAREYLTGRI
jgi:Ser/Thr protein kinase RdoA (MazF antagonist)